MIREIVVTSSKASTFLWLIPSVINAVLSKNLIKHLAQTLKVVQIFAVEYWKIAGPLAAKFRISKLDITQDYTGAFLPCDFKYAYDLVGAKLKELVRQMYDNC